MDEVFARSIGNGETLTRAREHLHAHGVHLPRISELADPSEISPDIADDLAGVDPDAADPRNLFRVHWHNDDERAGRVGVPRHIVLPEALTGVKARIAVVLGDGFPMIAAHKVLAAYGCLLPRLLTGQFDPTSQRAVWPSTGNYCRGGVAISTILGCNSVAVLPEGMSAERFHWLEKWVRDPADIIRTPGSESNLKEIYDACHALAQDDRNVVLNQFSEFGNYVIHRAVTGRALESVAHTLATESNLKPRAFVCASGSAGTLAAGDHLKAVLGMDVAAVEATECPTLLRNGYGEHNIQGIGDKHVPLIHNVFGTDFVIGVSDRSSDQLNVLFNSQIGRKFLSEAKAVEPEAAEALSHIGLSGIANIVAAIKLAKYLDLGADQCLLTVATDSSAMYVSQFEKTVSSSFPDGFSSLDAAEVFGREIGGIATDNLLELTRVEKDRIFNLGYYTWVEQQGTPLDLFEARRDQDFWDGMMDIVPVWDGMIDDFNASAP